MLKDVHSVWFLSCHRQHLLSRSVSLPLIFYDLYIYSREVGEEGDGGENPQADSPLSAESNVGLDSRTQRS